jgi:putative endonuclease
LTERGLDAAEAYLERAGLSVVEREYPTTHGKVGLIALENNGVLVFANVTTTRNSDKSMRLATPPMTRRYRRMVTSYLVEHELDMPVRFDLITILVIAEDRALLRHHRGWVEV